MSNRQAGIQAGASASRTGQTNARKCFAQRHEPVKSLRRSLAICLRLGTIGKWASDHTVVNRDFEIQGKSHMYGAAENRDRKSGFSDGSMPVLISYVDAEERFRFNNTAFEEWFARPVASLTGETLHEFFGDTIYSELLPYLEVALTGRQVAFESTLVRHDGESVFTQFILVPQLNPDGRTAGFYLLVSDFNQIRHMRTALGDSEALYHSLVEQLPMCLLHKDLKGRFTFANSQFLEFAGKTADEVIGRTDFDLFPNELARKYRDDDQKVVESCEILDTVESHQIDGEGEPRYVQILKTPMFAADRNVIGTQVLFWDVTEKHVAEAALNESTALKRAIFDSALDCIVLVDQDGVILDVNRSTERVFGYRRNELVGRNMDDTLVPPTASDRTQANRKRYNSDREEGSMLGKRVEISAQHKGGRVFDVEMAMQPIPYERRTIFAVFLHDITARKQAEAEIAQKNKDLETLLYVASHDLREPLRAIRSFTQLLLKKAGARLDETEQGFLTRVIDGADRLNQLLEDVLMLSRAQRASEGMQLVDSNVVARDVIRQFDVRLSETRGTVEIIGELPLIRVDPRWLRQSLFNLVGNALKFRNGEEPPSVEISAFESVSDEDSVNGLVVCDRGPGIADEHVERVFQLFQRAVGRKVEGTGAGLAIVRQVSSRYGGNAWYEPRNGGGSQFTITFRK